MFKSNLVFLCLPIFEQIFCMVNISVFASGSGSNAQKIYDYFTQFPEIRIDTLVCNNPNAGVLEKAKNWNCQVIMLNKKSFLQTEELSKILLQRKTNLIVLAGFLWLIPKSLIQSFPNKIINIHPALLPKYGGKGMHGEHVHKAVFDSKDKESGITVHYVNEEYDKGAPIFQARCNVEGLNPKEIAAAVLKLEHEHFPKVIHQLVKND